MEAVQESGPYHPRLINPVKKLRKLLRRLDNLFVGGLREGGIPLYVLTAEEDGALLRIELR